MIEVNHLTKHYGKHIALTDISFSVQTGEILGFLGPNGAGKSTTMNILTGYLSASSGTVLIDGIDILKKPLDAKKKIGYLPESPPLYMDMTVKEYLDFVCRIKKVEKKNQKDRIQNYMEMVKVEHVQDRMIKNLSKGYKQRVGLAQALIGDPEVIILDEPTVGLDPKQIIDIRNLIENLSRMHTIILSTHILSEVSAICDRVMIMNEGQIAASDSPDNLSKLLNLENRMALRIRGQEKDVIPVLKTIQGIETIECLKTIEEGTVETFVTWKEDMDLREDIFSTMSKNQFPILMMKPLDFTLEDIFLQLTEKTRITENVQQNSDEEIQNTDIVENDEVDEDIRQEKEDEDHVSHIE